MSVTDLALLPALLRALTQRGYSAPTPIQSAAIPAILAGRDVQASAQTGSGKSAAFCLPLLQRWNDEPIIKPRKVFGLILVPTRELAAQVGETLSNLASYLIKPVKLAVLHGGVSINPQMLHLRGGADLVVATPGRLLDLISQHALTLDQVKMLVLDEADRLLDEGFAEELANVLALLPAQRQNILLSATFPASVTQLAAQLLNDPAAITIAPTPVTQPDITQRAIAIDGQQRTGLLRHLIDHNDWDRVLVFASSRYATETIAMKLRKGQILAEPFHGELGQGKRNQVLADFKSGRIQVMVATDLAARGIDIPNLPVVVNYDPPRSSADYIHRIGRTGRAGAVGLAINFVTVSNDAHFQLIEKTQLRRLVRETIIGFEPVDLPPVVDHTGTGGIKGKRPSKKDKLRAKP